MRDSILLRMKGGEGTEDMCGGKMMAGEIFEGMRLLSALYI